MPSGAATVPDTVSLVSLGSGVQSRRRMLRAARRARDRINATSSSLARRTSSLTMVTSNSALGRQLDPRGGQPALALLLGLGAAADQPADQLVPARRRQEDEQRLGHRSRTWRAPCRSISSSAVRALGQRLLDRAARRAVPVAAVHDGPLEQLARRRPSGRTRRRRRSGSGRRRPRRAAACGSSPTPTARPRGSARGRRPTTVPLPTAVGPARTTSRRTAARGGARPAQAESVEPRSAARRSGWRRARGPGGSRRCRPRP